MHAVCDEMSKPGDELHKFRGERAPASSARALALGQVNTQLLEFAIQVGAL
jgi:hypothetical protein